MANKLARRARRATGKPGSVIGDDDAKRRALLNKVALSPWPEAAFVIGCGRTLIFRKIAAGEVKAIRHGQKMLVPTAPLRAMFGMAAE